MEQYVGLDVSQEQTSVCVVDGGGKVIWEGKCASTPEAIAAILRTRGPEAVRIGLESGPLSAWHWHDGMSCGSWACPWSALTLGTSRQRSPCS